MKNLLVLLIALAMIGSASAQYAPGTWGFAKPGAGNPYTFDGPDGSRLTDQTPDVWGTWGGDAQGNGDVLVSGGFCTITTDTWELAFSHDNALLDLPGVPVAGTDDLEVLLTVTSVTGAGYVSMKIEFYDETDAFPNDDNGAGSNGIFDFEAGGVIVTSPGVYSFNTAVLDQGPIPAGAVAATPVITVAGGATTAVIDEIWIGKAGAYSTTKAKDPNPPHKAVIGKTPKPTLSWTNPDPNNPADTITSDVFFLDGGSTLWANDPNMSEAKKDTGVIQVANNTTAESASLPVFVTLQDDHYYYWAVNCTDSGTGVETLGDIWWFYTGDALPVVNAGPDQFNWVSKEDGDGNPLEYTITVTGTYTDDGRSPIADANFVNLNWGWDPDNLLGNGAQRGVEKISQIWTPGPGTHTSGTVTAVYKTHYVEGDPAHSTDIPGYWDLQLQVKDGAGTGKDVAYVRVDPDCATAAESDASDNFDTTYDTNRNCRNDLADLAAFAARWLDQSVKYE